MIRGTGGPYDKSLARFSPLHSRSRADCEHHYFTRHYPWAREWLSGLPSAVSYHVDRAVAELEPDGEWSDEPHAWRFVSLRFHPGERPSQSPNRAEEIAQDHRNCLRELRSCAVLERFEIGSNSADAPGAVKFLFEYDRAVAADPTEAAARFRDLVDRLGPLVPAAAGLSTLIVNEVLSEGATEAIDEPGQRALGYRLDQTTKVGYLEFYFDRSGTGEEWLRSADNRRLLLDPHFEVARGYRIEENCGFDKR